MKLNENETQMVRLYEALAYEAIRKQPDHPFNFGFLWAMLEIRRRQKNGKLRTFKVKVLLTGSVSPNDWSAVQAEVNDLPGVLYTWVNMD